MRRRSLCSLGTGTHNSETARPDVSECSHSCPTRVSDAWWHHGSVIDLVRERALTPGCQDRVFLDSAGSSLPTSTVVETVIGHLRREAEVGGYRAAA